MGWGNLDDGPLLDIMAGRFDVLVTVYKNGQQRLDHRPFSVVVLRAKTNRLTDLLPLVPAVLARIAEAGAGEVHELVGQFSV